MQAFDVTGKADWEQARKSVKRLREVPPQPEANVQSDILSILRELFPWLPAHELTAGMKTGAGPADIYCCNVIFEVKKKGNLVPRPKPDGSTETPEQQLVRYLDALSPQSKLDMFIFAQRSWRGCVTDGREWRFYEYDRDAPESRRLRRIKSLCLLVPEDDEPLLRFLYGFINRPRQAVSAHRR